MMAIVTLKKY